MDKRLLIITGANGQISSYLAEQFAHDSNNELVLIYHKRNDRIQQLLTYANVSAYSLDLTNYIETQSLIDSILNQYINMDIALIHAAAVRSIDAKPLSETDQILWNEIFDANLKSSYNIMRAVLPEMRNRGFGRIVVFGSSVSNKGLANGSAYAAAKAAMVNLVKSVAVENADRNILINAISPAPVESIMSQDFSGDYLKFRMQYFEEHLARVPTRKLVSKNEIHKICEILVSKDIMNLCGQEIIIDGGLG